MATRSKLFILRTTANLLRKKRARTYVASVCGHTTKLTAILHAFDDQAEVDLPQNDRQLPMFCASCVVKRSIRCAWCSRAIFVGDPVTLHQTYDDFPVPLESHVFSTDPLRLVGCMHPDCADKSDPMSGFWRITSDGMCFVAEIEETKTTFGLRFANRKRYHYVGPQKK